MGFGFESHSCRTLFHCLHCIFDLMNSALQQHKCEEMPLSNRYFRIKKISHLPAGSILSHRCRTDYETMKEKQHNEKSRFNSQIS